MKVGLIGACDRNNYGDLLMPILFEKQYKFKYPNNTIEFEYYGQKERDMSYLMSKNTKALCDAYDNLDVAIVAGGEVFAANFKLMYFNLQKNKLKIFGLRCINKVFPKFMEKFAKKMLKGRTEKPWVLDKNKLNCKKLIYNTVGGNIGDNNEVMECIKNTDYIAIRNKKDYEKILKVNENTVMFPDSVVAISKYITENEFIDNVKEDIKKICNEDYFIIQIDKRNGKYFIEDIAEQVNKICKETNLNCILLPIGYAQGHEDQVVLKKILKRCKNEKVKLMRMTNIYETTFILKNAKMFIGTSLHGIILSTSYNVPHIVLTDKLKKLLNYMDTWNTMPIHYTDACEIFENFKKIYKNQQVQRELEIKSQKLIMLAEENFNNVNKIINEVL